MVPVASYSPQGTTIKAAKVSVLGPSAGKTGRPCVHFLDYPPLPAKPNLDAYSIF